MGGLINSCKDIMGGLINSCLSYILNSPIKAKVIFPFSVWFFYKDIMGGLINSLINSLGN
ncbi:MAG: hypothetical protein ACJAUK_002425 [Colwellia polaris]|jgi:hypothetical protein